MSRPDSRAHEWRGGWPVVAGSAAMAGVGAGLYQNLSSLFMPGIQQLTGASRGEIGASAALGLFAWFYPILSSARLPGTGSFQTYTWLHSWR